MRYRRLDERLECARVDLFALTDVNRAPRVAFEAGIEQARRVRDLGAVRERELHGLLVRLARADNAVARPHRNVPLPLFGDVRVGVQNQRAHAGERLAAPAVEFTDALVDAV